MAVFENEDQQAKVEKAIVRYVLQGAVNTRLANDGHYVGVVTEEYETAWFGPRLGKGRNNKEAHEAAKLSFEQYLFRIKCKPVAA